MELTPFIYKLLPKLADIGSFVALKGSYEIAQCDKGPRSFLLDGGILYDLNLVNTGGAVFISGTAVAHAHGECDRCLAPAQLELTGEVETYVVLGARGSDNQDKIDDCLVADDKDASIDLAPLIFSAVILAIPPIVLCREDCAGLCPGCGAHLNEEPCSCSVDSVDENHPFAALKDLL